MFTTTGKQESRVKEEQGVGVWTPTQHLPRMRIFLGPGWWDASPKKGLRAPEASLDPLVGPLNVHFKL